MLSSTPAFHRVAPRRLGVGRDRRLTGQFLPNFRGAAWLVIQTRTIILHNASGFRKRYSTDLT
jgi:hypothetical protein